MARVSVASYLGLASGPGFSSSTERGSSFPVEGSNPRLRGTSPFTFRVVPPDTLLAALAGQGEARPQGNFAAALQLQRAQVEAEIAAGTATPAQLEVLTGTRAPATPSFAVIDAALSTHNFKQVQGLRKTVGRSLSAPIAPSTPLIAGNGKRFTDTHPAGGADQAMSDLAQGRSMLNQVRQMLSTPPLTLLVNPQNLAITYTKKQAYQDRNRHGYIFQSWGEDLPKLSISGKTGAFYAGASSDRVDERGFTSSPSGVQWINRRDSASWQNLTSLLLIYRNNGIIYDLLGKSQAHQWIGYIEISYDQWIYQGHFESFQYSFTEETQNGGIEFSFEFSVSHIFDVGQRGPVLPQASTTPSASDPRWLAPLKSSSLPTGSTTSSQPSEEEVSTAILDPFVLR